MGCIYRLGGVVELDRNNWFGCQSSDAVVARKVVYNKPCPSFFYHENRA